MPQGQAKKLYDLEDRTLAFARSVRAFVRTAPRTASSVEDVRQLVRASGSVGANYIEANESLGKKDFLMRIKICRKEAKECRYWLDALKSDDKEAMERERVALRQEAVELMKILGAILQKSQ